MKKLLVERGPTDSSYERACMTMVMPAKTDWCITAFRDNIGSQLNAANITKIVGDWKGAVLATI